MKQIDLDRIHDNYKIDTIIGSFFVKTSDGGLGLDYSVTGNVSYFIPREIKTYQHGTYYPLLKSTSVDERKLDIIGDLIEIRIENGIVVEYKRSNSILNSLFLDVIYPDMITPNSAEAAIFFSNLEAKFKGTKVDVTNSWIKERWDEIIHGLYKE